MNIPTWSSGGQRILELVAMNGISREEQEAINTLALIPGTADALKVICEGFIKRGASYKHDGRKT